MPFWAWPVIGGILLAAASFFFALSESALFSLGRWRASRLLVDDPVRGRVVNALLESAHDLLATVGLLNTLANAGLLGLALWLGLSRQWGPGQLTAVTLGVFIVVVIGGEVIPKTLAVRNPVFWSVRVAVPMTWVLQFSRPLVQFINQRLQRWVLDRWIPKSWKVPVGLSDEEFQELAELAWQSGSIGESEKELIVRIIRLDRRTARDAMRQRSQMVCVPDDMPLREMLGVARRSGHERLPLYDVSTDTIVGVLNTRKLLLDPGADLADSVEFPSFVPSGMNLLQLLKSLQRQRRGLAVVVDEYGGTAGLITLADILDELVGEERGKEEEVALFERSGPGCWIVNGRMRVESFQRECPALVDPPDAETIGGLVVRLMEVVPPPGATVSWRGVQMTVTRADARRVEEVRVLTPSRKGVKP